MTCRILLTTTVGWSSVARLAHGFSAASCAVDAHAPADSMVFVSRYVSGRYAYKPLSPTASLRAAIEQSKPDLLVACDDRAVTQILKLHAEAAAKEPPIAELIERSLGEPASYAEMMSRSGFMMRARSLGIRVPETRPVSTDKDIDGFVAETGLPIVLKADGSWGGDGVIVAREPGAPYAARRKLANPPSRLRSLARTLRRRDAHYLGAVISRSRTTVSAQKFVSGRPAASAFACWQGEVIAAIYYDVLVADGEIGPPNVIRRVECPEMEDATHKIARHYRLSGIHGMDFLRDATGAVHLIEINPRATQGSTLAFGPGKDMPAALASRLQPEAGIRKAILNDTVALFPREWQRDPASPWLRSAHHDVPWDDPAVLLASLKGMHLAPSTLNATSQEAVASEFAAA